jgi:predicted GTPase
LTLDHLDPGGEEYERVAASLRELVPVLQAVRVFDVFSLSSKRVAQVVESVDRAVQPDSSRNISSST